MNRIVLCLSLFLFVNNDIFAQAKTDTANRVFTLGEVSVTGYKANALENAVSAAKNDAHNRMDVSHSLNLLPGITLSAIGPRNESGIYVRGFDLRQVPIYMDGVPVYIPYDGYVDLARFTVFDVAEIQVSKGYSSVLYGPNAMGGAINLISRKPVNKFEANATAGWLTGGYRLNTNIGGKLRKMYWQVSASKLQRDYFQMSSSFDTVKTENGGERGNSYNDDVKISAKIGFTPKAGQEYAAGYIYQQGKKGTPVYAGSDTLNSLYKAPRYWQWPDWDKQSIYLITNNKIDSNNYIRTRFYYDQFKNGLFSYDDATYTKISKPYAFKSIYDDYSVGGNIEFGNTSVRNNTLGVAVHFKQDVHREHNEGEPVRTMSDNNLTFAVEDNYLITSKLNATAGLSYTTRNSLDAEGYNSTTKAVFNYIDNDNAAWNYQGSLRYNFNTNRSVNVSVARKARFATMKDRYSFRMGTAVPNPDLISESAVNYEVGYNDQLAKKVAIHAAVFYSRISNTIQMVNNVQLDTATNKWLSQLQNTGKSEFYGGEISFEYKPLKQLVVDANYTYIVRNNLANKALLFTDVPTHKVFVSLQYKPVSSLYVVVDGEYNSKRNSTSYGAISGDFFVANAKAHYNIYKAFSIEGGVNNVFDRNYTLVEGYPEPGRNYFASLVFNY